MRQTFTCHLCSHLHSHSWGPIPWLYPPEVSSAIGIARISLIISSDYASVCARKGRVLVYCCKSSCEDYGSWILTLRQTNWAFNFLVGEMTPYLQEVIQWRLYPMHGFFCACSFIVGESINEYQLDLITHSCVRSILL